VSGAEGGNSGSQVRGTRTEGTSCDTPILVSEGVHGTISQSQEHFGDNTGRATISGIIKVGHGTSHIHLSIRPDRGISGSFVALNGSSSCSS